MREEKTVYGTPSKKAIQFWKGDLVRNVKLSDSLHSIENLADFSNFLELKTTLS